jgi:DNA mismatch endonuclease Vsr
MADTLSTLARSERMSRIKGANTGPELRVRSLIHRLGYRFRLHRRDLPGRPDIVLPRHRTVVFVHGCFWHRHEAPTCKLARLYALYYKGSFRAYRQMAQRNTDTAQWPIYVGKAIPKGGRRGASLFSEVSGRYLLARLKDHADSIREATNLRIEDFSCRHLRVDDIWIPLGETLLISRFKPVWNLLLDGFGNHDPGAGRYEGLIPLWDVLHPGRPWANKLKARQKTSADLSKRVTTFLSENEPPPDPHISFGPAE